MYFCRKCINYFFTFAMKKKLITALATKFEGVDAKVFGRIADNIMDRKTIETDEDVEAAVAEISFKDVLESYGDARATESARTAKRNAISDYEKRYKLKDGKKVAQKDDDDNDDDDDDDPNADPNDDDKSGSAVLAAMKKMFAGLEQKLDAANNEIAAMKKGKITDGRKAQLAELMKGFSEKERKMFDRISVDDMSDEDFATVLNDVKEIADEKAAAGAAFLPPLGGDSGNRQKVEVSDADVDEVVSKLNL